MTQNLKVERLLIHNPYCDGAHCRVRSGPVRVLPLGGGSNLLLCQACCEHENAWRRRRNLDLRKAYQFDTPEWNDLEVYPPSLENTLESHRRK